MDVVQITSRRAEPRRACLKSPSDPTGASSSSPGRATEFLPRFRDDEIPVGSPPPGLPPLVVRESASRTEEGFSRDGGSDACVAGGAAMQIH